MQPPTTVGPRDGKPHPSLTSSQFHILLTLVQGQLHGYGIMLEIERRTDGAVELGPGTLYRSIKQLLAHGLIAEVKSDSARQTDAGSQRRTYALTPRGRACTAEEAQRQRALARWIEDSMVLEGGQP